MYKMICIPRRLLRRHLSFDTIHVYVYTAGCCGSCMHATSDIYRYARACTYLVYIYVPAGRTRGATIATASRSVLRTERAQQQRRNGTCTPYIQRKRNIHNLTYTYVYAHASPCTNLTELNGTTIITTTEREQQQRSGSCTAEHAGDIRRRRHNGIATRGPATREPASTTTCTQGGVGGTSVRATERTTLDDVREA
jgi:hypothetical protein